MKIKSTDSVSDFSTWWANGCGYTIQEWTMVDDFKNGFFTVLNDIGLGGSVRESEKDGMLHLMVFLRTGEDEAPGVTHTVKNPRYRCSSITEGKPGILPSPFHTYHSGRECANGMVQELQRMVRRAFELMKEEQASKEGE